MPRAHHAAIPAVLALAAAVTAAAPDTAAARADGPDHYRVVNIAGTEHLALRARPHRFARVIAEVAFDARHLRNLVDRRGPWVRVAHRGVRGWAHMRHLAEAGYRDEPTLYRVVNVGRDDHLNVRRRPTTRSRVIARLDPDTRDLVARGRCEGNWCPIDCEGAVAWVYKRYIAVQGHRDPYRTADYFYEAGDLARDETDDPYARRRDYTEFRRYGRHDHRYERPRPWRRLKRRVRRWLD